MSSIHNAPMTRLIVNNIIKYNSLYNINEKRGKFFLFITIDVIDAIITTKKKSIIKSE